MIKLIRRTLRPFPALYSEFAKAYHATHNFLMRLVLSIRGVKYLPPRKTGGAYCSQYGQDYYLEKLGLVSPKSYFVEVGCNHPRFGSNSHFLEHQLRCAGTSIDAIDFSELFAEERPNTRFIKAIVDENRGESAFYQVRDVEGWENQVSSLHKETLQMGKGFEADVVRIETIPLSDIIEPNRAVDVLLVDVEGHEFSVLNSLNWEVCRPRVILIENSGQFYPRSKLERYIVGKGYEFLARIGTSDDIYVLNKNVSHNV